MLQRKKLASLLLLAGVVSAGPAFAQSGSFTFVTGEVNVQRKDGQRVAVTKGTPVNPGDAIVTGTRGMAQLTMVDQAKISLRPNTQFQIEQYADRPDSDQGALLNLIRGTLRTFTGLIASRNRDRFVMKTKVATVGIRGSGNVLFAGTAADCDPAKVEASGGGCDITVNHTIEGSHAVTFGDFSAPGLPAQQGGAQTLVTGPGQTVLVTGRGDVSYIPTPQFIADAATNPTGAAKTPGGAGGGGDETRNFGPNDGSGSSTVQGTSTTTPVGNNGLGFSITDASGNLIGGEPLG
ncbi:MAG: FecR domain-containing protein, partial [Burkholderiales bacterium]|nr:FecR domain-containing protein [Burkholderiales bacterium]